MRALNSQEWAGTRLEVSLAKPPSDKKKKEDMLRKREQRMMEAMAESMTRAEGMEFSSGPRGGWGGGCGGKMRIRSAQLLSHHYRRWHGRLG